MSKVLVAGAGLAGLSAAVELSSCGHEVKLIEGSPKPGGRAYSFYHPPFNSEIDNGQHIMTGCYDYTFKFLEKIGALDKLDIQDYLRIAFVDRGGRTSLLNAGHTLYPFNLANGLLRFSALSLRQRVKLAAFFPPLLFSSGKELENLSVYEWLKKHNTDERTIIAFWEILTVGIMNASIHKAQASLFVKTIKQVFFGGTKASSIVIPKQGLSEVFCSPAEEYLKQNNSALITGERVVEITSKDSRVFSIKTNKREIKGFDYYILAVSPWSAAQLMPQIKTLISGLQYSPIMTVHINLKENPFDEKFYGLIGSSAQWIFNHGSYISVVTSCAEEFINVDSSDAAETIIKEISEYFPCFTKKQVKGYKVIKEKRATFIPDVKSSEIRKMLTSPYVNMALCGDWTDTGLPATIEGAVKSGIIASQKANDFLNK